MERREFIKNVCVSCGVISLMSTFPLTLLQSCTSLPMLRTSSVGKNIVINKVKLTPEKNLFVLRSDDLQYDVLLVKNKDNTYYALYMQCTHQDNAVTANDKGLNCSLHGSSFDLEGKVTNGPAMRELKKYTVTETTDSLTINII
jgi:nitrite reductase/ring-hydroxylating ferredoxin subunit